MANLNQSHFRFGKEELLEATHGWWQNEDTNHTQLITADWAFLLRFTEQEPGVTAISNVDAQFQYNKNGAGWVDITTTSSVVKAVASVAFTNGQACTKRLSGTGTFESSGAGCTEDGSSGGTANDIVLSGNSETEAGLQIVFADVASGDTIQFRLTSPDATMVYLVTPTLTVTKPAIVEGIASGSGNGLSSSASLLYVLGASAVSGAGLANSLGILDIFGVVSASGSGLASSLALLYVLAEASGQGAGLAIADGDAFPGFEVVEGIGAGSGIGLGSSQGLLDIIAQAVGSGEGIGEGITYLIVPAGVLGSGVGGSSSNSYLVIPATVEASGNGLAETVAELITLAEALGSGVGEGQFVPYLIILPTVNGSGSGQAEATGDTIIPEVIVEGLGLGSGEGSILVTILRKYTAPAGYDMKVYEATQGGGEIWL